MSSFGAMYTALQFQTGVAEDQQIAFTKTSQKAEEELGAKFDIRAFHEVILEQGTVTLSILENRINAYIKKAQNE